MKSKKTGKSSELDQFYTNSAVAKRCIDEVEKLIPASGRKVYIEPSAGTGSFSSQLKNCIAIDIDPQNKKTIQADFLSLERDEILSKKDQKNSSICVIGNPPFGKNSSLAVKFFNHATLFADTIAFIVPKTFRKQSLTNKLHLNYWLVLDLDLEKNSFIYQNQPFDTPSCFQVWVRKKLSRQKVKFEESKYLKFVRKSDADFAVRRVGGKTGTAYLDVNHRAEVSHYFLKVTHSKKTKEQIVEIINSIDFSKEANSTAGVRSISRGEFLAALDKKIK